MIIEKRIPITYWLNTIKWNLLIVTIFSSAVYFASEFLIEINVPISIGAFLGTAIALLLSFKLSHSYDRWWEARKIWGSIVNDSRSLVMQLKAFANKEDKDVVHRIAYRQIAWCYSLSQNLRKENATNNIGVFVEEQELKTMVSHNNIPLALLNNQSQDLAFLHKNKSINDFQQVQIDSTIVRLCTAMGKAERIKNTAFPKTYRITLHLFIYFFLVVLSLALTEMHSLVEIPFMIFISIPFFLLEKIAFNIQDPFENRPTDTAMTSISRTIEINIKQQLGLEDVPEPLKPNRFYIL